MSAPTAPLAQLDVLRRYDVETALRYLGISRKTFYRDVAAGRIKVLKHGRRTFCHGSEIARVSAA
jgi:excisionase family DNA binding protein